MPEVWGNLFSAPFDLDTLIARGEIAGPVSLDLEIGREVKGSEEPCAMLDELVHARYPGSVILFSDGARGLVTEWVRACFCVPASGYRFGVRLSDFTSALSAELYAVFCALKNIFRLQVPSAVIFTDSLFSLYHLRDRLSSFRVSPFAYKILHLAALIRERGGSVGFAWVLSHAGIAGNELADSVAKSASVLPLWFIVGFQERICFFSLSGITSHGVVVCGLFQHRRLVTIGTLTGSHLRFPGLGSRDLDFPGVASA